MVNRAKGEAFTIDNHVQFDFNTGDIEHKLLSGINYQRIYGREDIGFGTAPTLDAFDPQYGAHVPVPETEYNTNRHRQTGIYLQDQLRLGGWIANLGVRHDEADTRITNGGSNFGLDDELEAGLKYKPPGSNALFTAAVFDLTQENVLTPDLKHLGFSEQTGEVRSRGFELEAKAPITDRLPEAPVPLLIVQFKDDRHVWVYGQNSLLQGVLDQLGLTNAWNRPTGGVGVSVISIDVLPAIEGRLVILKSPQYDSRIRDRLNRGELWQGLLRMRGNDAVYLSVNYWPLGALPSAIRFADALVEGLESS